MKEYVYSVYYGAIYRIEKERYSYTSPGYAYEKGIGWTEDSPANGYCYIIDDGGVDEVLTEEQAKQWIRDHYNEEPVDFYEDTKLIENVDIDPAWDAEVLVREAKKIWDHFD